MMLRLKLLANSANISLIRISPKLAEKIPNLNDTSSPFLPPNKKTKLH